MHQLSLGWSPRHPLLEAYQDLWILHASWYLFDGDCHTVMRTCVTVMRCYDCTVGVNLKMVKLLQCTPTCSCARFCECLGSHSGNVVLQLLQNSDVLLVDMGYSAWWSARDAPQILHSVSLEALGWRIIAAVAQIHTRASYRGVENILACVHGGPQRWPQGRDQGRLSQEKVRRMTPLE